MNRSKIDVANEALILVGADRIATFDDGSAEGVAIAGCYETEVGAALTAPGGSPYRWTFATRQEALTLLATAPTARWERAFQVPPDCLQIHAITSHDMVVPFAIHQDRILTDADAPLVADYTFRADESAWPPAFTQCMVFAIASKLALIISENAELSMAMARQVSWAGARTGDSQSQTAPVMRATRLTGARHGGRGRRW